MNVYVCLTGAGDGTLLAGFIPGPADVVRAAAELLGHVEGQLSITRGVIRVVVPVAQALAHIWTHSRRNASASAPKDTAGVTRVAWLTHAVVSSVDLHVLGWADAGVVPYGVVTLTRTADALTVTLIHIYTHTMNQYFNENAF